MEPITVARKPLAGTVAANVLKNGAGALNIDGCRVGELANGRWPANLIHDGSDEVLALFPDAPGQQCASSDNQRTRANCYGALSHGDKQYTPRADSGSAARFFYCAKTSRKDRNEGLQDPGPQLKHGATLRQVENSATTGNTHPTVKPSDLMAYLCRLVTPPGGVVLDPFMGSGSTGKAAMREGFQFIGCELDPAYFEIARARIENELPTWSIGMPIYMTHFDPVTKLPTSGSIDSGFGSIDEAVAVLGDNYLSRGVRSVTYPGVMLTDYVLTASSRQVKLPADS